RIQSKAEVADGWNKLGHDDEKVGASKLRRRLSQMHGDLAEQRVVHAGLLQMPEALHHIFHVAPSLTLAALDDADLRFERKVAGILSVVAVDEIGQRLEHPARAVEQAYGADRLDIDVGDLLALAEIRDRLVLCARGDAVDDTAAGAASIEPEHEAWCSMGAAMHHRIDAERAMRALEQGRLRLGEGKAWSPHQRAVAEHPEFNHYSRHAQSRAGHPHLWFSEVIFVDGRDRPGYDERISLPLLNRRFASG